MQPASEVRPAQAFLLNGGRAMWPARSVYDSFRAIFPNTRVINEQMYGRRCGDFPFVASSRRRISSLRTLKPRPAMRDHVVVASPLVAKRAGSLDTRSFVPCRSIVLCQFCLYYCRGVEFIRNDEIRRLVEARDPLLRV